VHDALLRVWLRPTAYRLERGELRAFLIVCVRNTAIDRKRSAARRFSREEAVRSEPTCAIETLPETDYVEHAKLVRALETLPPEQRAVIGLAYFGELSQSQIATRLNAPLGTIKSRAALGLRRLALALGRTPGDIT